MFIQTIDTGLPLDMIYIYIAEVQVIMVATYDKLLSQRYLCIVQENGDISYTSDTSINYH